MVMNREAVTWGYRLFLDREPESESVILEKMTGPKNSKELRREFMQSNEFRTNNPPYATALCGDEPRMSIEEVSSAVELQVLFEHIQDSWHYLGKTEPYWSVLATEKFLQANFKSAATIAEFYETGKQDVNRILKTLERNQIDYTLFKSCLEYGCGLGRVTRWLAEIFDIVYGYDISQEHLQIAKKYIDSKYSNVLLSHLREVKDIKSLPKVDFIYSVIVLQHNPPPVIRFIIQHFIKALNPKGIALFQVPTYRMGYEFSYQKYLSEEGKRRDMEMHLLPQSQVFEAIGQEGGRLIEVIEDGLTGSRFKEVSNTFLVQKE